MQKTDETDYRKYFPHTEKIKPGSWCKDGIFIQCDKTLLEISVYREPESNSKYAGTLTLQIFAGDDVIFWEKLQDDIEKENENSQ